MRGESRRRVARADIALPRRARWARRATGLATVVAGALFVISAITPDVPWRHHVLLAIEPGPAIELEHVVAAFGGLAVAYLGWGILRGRRRAANIALRLLAALALGDGAQGGAPQG